MSSGDIQHIRVPLRQKSSSELEVLTVDFPSSLPKAEVDRIVQKIVEEHRARWDAEETKAAADPNIKNWKQITPTLVDLGDNQEHLIEQTLPKAVVKEAEAIFESIFSRIKEFSIESVQKTLGLPPPPGQSHFEKFFEHQFEVFHQQTGLFVHGDTLTEKLYSYQKQVALAKPSYTSQSAVYKQILSEVGDILESNPSAIYEWGPQTFGYLSHLLYATQPERYFTPDEQNKFIETVFIDHLIHEMRKYKLKDKNSKLSTTEIFNKAYESLVIKSPFRGKRKQEVVHNEAARKRISRLLSDPSSPEHALMTKALTTKEHLPSKLELPKLWTQKFRPRTGEDIIFDMARVLRNNHPNFLEKLALLHPSSDIMGLFAQGVFLPYATTQVKEMKKQEIHLLERRREKLQRMAQQAKTPEATAKAALLVADVTKTIDFLTRFDDNPLGAAKSLQSFQRAFHKILVSSPNDERVGLIFNPAAASVETLDLSKTWEKNISLSAFLEPTFHYGPQLRPTVGILIEKLHKSLLELELIKDKTPEEQKEFEEKKAELLKLFNETLPALQAEAQKKIKSSFVTDSDAQIEGIDPDTGQKELRGIFGQLFLDYDRQRPESSVNARLFPVKSVPKGQSDSFERAHTTEGVSALQQRILGALRVKLDKLADEQGENFPEALKQLRNDPNLQERKALQIMGWLCQQTSINTCSFVMSHLIQRHTPPGSPVSWETIRKYLGLARKLQVNRKENELIVEERESLMARSKESYVFTPDPGDTGVYEFSSNVEIDAEVDFLANDGEGTIRIKYRTKEPEFFDPLVSLLTVNRLAYYGSSDRYGSLI